MKKTPEPHINPMIEFFQLGEVARLKSGGIWLTVTAVNGNEIALMGYSEGPKDRFHELEGIHPACLEKKPAASSDSPQA